MKKVFLTITLLAFVTLIVACNRTQYMLVFNSNGGSEVESIIAYAGDPITQPENPTREGYTFQGWFKDNNTFEEGFAFTRMPEASYNLYAKWFLGSVEKYPQAPNVGAEVPFLDGGWVSVWNDEFSGTALDSTKWNHETGGSGWGNQELQYYRPENTTISDGVLTITAKNESFGGRNYTSSRLTTKYKGDWTYGRIQVRAKMPDARGTWSAIWMMPTMSVYGGWPNSGEIDIMEHVGYDLDQIHSTIHTTKYNHNKGNSIGFGKTMDDVINSFHVYEIIWQPGQIEAYVDGEPVGAGVFRYTAGFNRDVPYDDAWPFDQNFFLIMNVAVGGTWGGAQGVDSTAFPTSMQVDYVRVYQRDFNYYDGFNPSKVENIQESELLDGSIWWNPATDDLGVKQYEIWVNDEYKKKSNLNQTMMTNLGLTSGTYEVKIRAVDFVGNFGEFSEPFTYQHD